MTRSYPSWIYSEYTQYGAYPPYGIGVYQYDPDTYRKLKFWPDVPECTTEELQKYADWLTADGYKIPEEVLTRIGTEQDRLIAKIAFAKRELDNLTKEPVESNDD